MNEDINRIVELEIDLDDMQLEEMGVDVVSFVYEPAIEVDFLAFNQDAPKPYVDNKGVEKFEEWIYSNIDKFKKPGGDLTAQGGTNHKEQIDKLLELGIPTEFPMGYCFQVAQFMFYALGGYDGPYTLKCIKKMQIPLDGIIFQTSHWYLQDEESGQIIDLTASQFEGITDINDWYKDGRRANLGFSWYKVNGEKLEFENTVPSIQTLKLYSYWKEENGELEGIEKYYKACKYEELRKEFELQLSKQEFVEPRAGEDKDEFIGRCVPIVTGEGYDQDQALAICYSYYEGSYDPSNLSPYVDYGDDLRRKEFAEECYVMSSEEEEIILKWAEEHGEQITEEYTFINPKEEFNTVSDVAKAIQGLDILGKLGVRRDEPAEIKYRYTGPSAERGFCKAMLRLNKLYSEDDMSALEGRLSVINPGMGPRGLNSYNVFAYKGGVNCRHFWSKNALFKPQGSNEVLVIDQGPAEGDAGKSNNSNRPSPTGSVSNNASLRRRNFSFSIEDDEKRIVAGPLMVPNQFILRRDENGEPYYVFFSKDTIKRIQERFNKKKNHNVTDLDHDGNIIEDNILLEQWIVESRQYDKSRYYGFDNMPLGTWFGVYKVNDDRTWERIKNGELKGFSIAGDFINKAKPVQNEEDELLDKIINILGQIR